MTAIAHISLVTAFVAGAIFGNLLWFQYWWRSNWRSTPTGKVMFALFAVIALSYDLSVLALLLPEVFMGGPGEVIRIVARWGIVAVLASLYLQLVRAQRAGRPGPVRADDVTPPEGVRHEPRE